MNSTPSLAIKNRIYSLAWKVSHKRSGYEFQEMLLENIQGHDYYSDDYEAYKTVLYWPAIHHLMKDKNETYWSVTLILMNGGPVCHCERLLRSSLLCCNGEIVSSQRHIHHIQCDRDLHCYRYKG